MMLVTLALVALVGQSFGKIVSVDRDSIVFAKTDQLQDIIEGGGAATDYINCDRSSEHTGSIGDFETVRRCRALEVEQKQCLIPCAVPAAMECTSDSVKIITAETIYLKCLNLTEKDTDPATGLYAKNAATQEHYGGACKDNTWLSEGCKEALGDACNAPDSQCRWFCPGDQATRDAYCNTRMAEILTTRNTAIRLLKDIVQAKVNKRGLQSSETVRSSLSETFLKRALGDNENEDFMLLSQLLKDDTIDWDN